MGGNSSSGSPAPRGAALSWDGVQAAKGLHKALSPGKVCTPLGGNTASLDLGGGLCTRRGPCPSLVGATPEPLLSPTYERLPISPVGPPVISPSLLPKPQTHSPAKPRPSRMCTPMPPSATSQAATPSTSSWASGWHGRWRRSTGRHRGRSSTCQQAPWPSPSPSSPSSPSSASASSSTAGGRTSGGSWVAPGGANWPRHCSSSASGCCTSSSPPWRPIATSRGFRWWRDRAVGGRDPLLRYLTRHRSWKRGFTGGDGCPSGAAAAQKVRRLGAKKGKTITE